MVTGVEATSLALAVIPLLVNQLDNYVQGLQTLRSFRTWRYKKDLERYSTMLGGQRAILINTLTSILGDAIIIQESSKLLDGPNDGGPIDPQLDKTLQLRLGHNYDAFAALMIQALDILKELARRLRVEATSSSAIPWDDSNVVMRELQKIKHVFSKTIYTDLFNTFNTANSMLRILAEQTGGFQRRDQNRYSQRSPKQYTMARTLASKVHKALIGSEYWGCLCQDKHNIRFMLDSSFAAYNIPEKLRFRMILVTKLEEGLTATSYRWQEMEIEPFERPTGSTSTTGTGQSKRRKVQFLVSTPTQGLCADIDHLAPSIPLTNICSALSGLVMVDKEPKHLGYLADGPFQHNIFVTKGTVGSLPSQTLEDLILSSSSSPWNATGPVFCRRDRLCLAARLACSVLLFHGSWLYERWSSRDIMFSNKTMSFEASVHQPFLVCGISSLSDDQKKRSYKIQSSVIRNETLFPLGLVLIELSLCRSIVDLRIPEDENSDEEVTLLKTANRCLDYVYTESGTRYGDVVQQCFSWPHTRKMDIDNEEFQAAVFHYIISPLLDDVEDFGGKIGETMT
ncbi:uncharacterized protein BDW43DRAFT_314699 [Aspergillus alliaceus]|uniref:uncharacterized protein n=1 Tax=Petromyces alliaceus TaxID=209559 RepID=UPI0012A3C5C3|nr:uncharacterized protein BDW43DRAFT_314699 [Aspergillus alliaceus]KAB8229664.1 hypothetical protein BDW43DRAFT_314699 [Aspergillus alliaceus]